MNVVTITMSVTALKRPRSNTPAASPNWAKMSPTLAARNHPDADDLLVAFEPEWGVTGEEFTGHRRDDKKAAD